MTTAETRIAQIDTSAPPPPQSGLEAEQDIIASFPSDQYSDEERLLVDLYTETAHGSQGMNSYLRGAPPFDPSVPHYCEMFQELLLKYTLPHPVNVLRGVKNDGLIANSPIAGTTITNYGFTSTSFDPTVPEQFATGLGPVGIGATKYTGETSPIIFDIHVPQGMPCLPVSGLATEQSALAEHELILPDAVKFHVMADFTTPIAGQPMRVLKVVALPPTGAAGPPPRQPMPDVGADDTSRLLGDSSSMQVHAPEPGDAEKAGAALDPETRTAAFDPNEKRDDSGKWTAGGKSADEIKDFLDGIGGAGRGITQLQYALKTFQGLGDEDAKAHAEHYLGMDAKPGEQPKGDWMADAADYDTPISTDAFNTNPSKVEKEIGGPDWDRMDDSDISAVSDYVGGGYESVNQMLRGERGSSAKMLDIVSRMNKIMNNYQLPRPVEVLRGMNAAHLPRGKDLTGKSITFKGLTSTSFDPSVVGGFMSGANNAVMDIKVPEGTHCLPTGGLQENSEEHELVLPHGTKVKIVGESTKNVGGQTVRVVHCEMVPQKAPRSRKKSDFDPGEKRDNSGKWTSDEDEPSLVQKMKSFVPHPHADEEIAKDAAKKLSLNKKQTEALKVYTSTGKAHNFRRMNDFLRDPETFRKYYGEDKHHEVQNYCRDLSQAIDNYELPVNAHVTRGVTNSSGWLPDDIKGKTITNTGFASTSFNPFVGEVFSIDKDQRSQKMKPAAVMDIFVPKGFHALPASVAGSSVSKEDELILPNKCRFYVKDEVTDDEGTRRIQCIAMPPKSGTTAARESQPRNEKGSWTEGGGPASEASAERFLKSQYGDYRKNLPSLHAKAVLLYGSPKYAVMNALLAGQDPKQIKKTHGVNTRDLAMAGVANRYLSAAIRNAPPTEKSLTVFRQVPHLDLKRGAVLSEPGFTSASLVNNPTLSAGMTAEIRLPVGTQAMGGLKREMILAPGSKFRVEQASRRGDRPHVVMTHLIPGVRVTAMRMGGVEDEARDASGKWTSGSMSARRAPTKRFDPISTEGWKRTGPQAGSNPGGKFKDNDGQEWYVKQSKSEKHARNEALAAELYHMAGVDIPDVRLTKHHGKLGTASKMLDHPKSDLLERMDDPEYRRAAQDGFATHAWLGNWDAVGLDYDNIVSDKDGKPVMIDPGGSILYRAQGGEKGDKFSDDVDEWHSMRKPSRNTGALFGDMDDDQLKKSVQHIADVSPDAITDAVKRAGFSPEDQKFISGRLIKRREDLMKKTHIKSSAVAVRDLNGELLARTSGLALQMGDRVDATVLGMYWGSGTIDYISTDSYGGTKLFPAYHVTADDGQNDWFPPIALTKIG